LLNDEIKSPEKSKNSFQLNAEKVVEVISTLWSSRKLIVAIVGGATALAIVICLFLPKYYRSTTTILPETEKSKLGSLGGLSDLASLAGVNTGEGSLVKLYPIIIKSEAVLRNVLYSRYRSAAFKDSVNLLEYWEIEASTPGLAYELALKALQDDLEVSMEIKTSVVTISTETKEPQLSADIINKVASELDQFIRTKRRTNASEQRKWIEVRLLEVKRDLEQSENALREFREKNRRVSDSPQLLLEQDRLIRDVQINAALYAELKKQYELIKIEEIKNIPIINIMDPGRPAARKERPKRIAIVFTTFLLSLIASVGYVLVANQYKQQIRSFLTLVRDAIRPPRRIVS
jgi:uncharacterized protein involved in exopolysaccharide biosynthesis